MRRKQPGAIRNPTVRKVRNRGYTPIRYRTANGCHTGWIIHQTRTKLIIRLVGEERNRRVDIGERRYMTEIGSIAS